jgi:acyl-CoA synthetase (AMP-forming)/AMP-acid ligase II
VNVGTFLTKAARTFPGNAAVVFAGKTLTYAEFNARVNRLANAMRALGVQPGDTVAILQFNRPETLEALFASFKAGCGAVPINFRLHPDEYAYIIDHAEAKIVICSSEFNDDLLRIRDRLPRVRHLVAVSGAHGGMLDYEKLLSAASSAWSDVSVHPDDLAWLFYTSGTTGRPKGAILTHRNLVAMAMNFYADICPGFGPTGVMLHAAPLSHGSGLYAIPSLAKGAKNVIMESKSFDAGLVLKAVEAHGVTAMFVAPSMLKLLVESPARAQHDYRSLRSLIYGGGPILIEDLQAAIRRLGPCLVQLYGQGEAPMTITYLPHGDHILDGSSQQMRRLASAGFARTDVDVRIVGPAGQELPAGEIGEIVTRSDLVMKGYWRDPGATEKTIRDGWLFTGDIGYMDEARYVFIMDRSKDMIISGGENIYPREIEEVIIKHPSVREVAVIGVPDSAWGEAVKAVIVLKAGMSLSQDEILDFCAQWIARYKKPKSVDFVPELPKNAYGKIMKRELRAPYWQGRDRSI